MLNLHWTLWSNSINCFLQMTKLRHREVKWFAQGHTATCSRTGKWTPAVGLCAWSFDNDAYSFLCNSHNTLLRVASHGSTVLGADGAACCFGQREMGGLAEPTQVSSVTKMKFKVLWGTVGVCRAQLEKPQLRPAVTSSRGCHLCFSSVLSQKLPAFSI